MVGYKVLLGTSSYRSHRLLLSQVAPSNFKVVLGKEERGFIAMARGRGNWVLYWTSSYQSNHLFHHRRLGNIAFSIK